MTEPQRSPVLGVLFALYLFGTPLVAAVFLMMPALLLLVPLPFAVPPAINTFRLKAYRAWIGLVMWLWLRLPAALLELRGMNVQFDASCHHPPRSDEPFLLISNHPTRIDW